ncbi:hypothetical protein ACF0H5_021645 [Mactra antiquata]
MTVLDDERSNRHSDEGEFTNDEEIKQKTGAQAIIVENGKGGSKNVDEADRDGGVESEDMDPEEDETTKPEQEALVAIETSEGDGWVPDGGWGWGIVIGAVIVHIFIGGLMKASGVMYLKLKDRFNQSSVATAWVFSLFTTFLLMMGPVASALCHRFTCRSVVFFGSILCFIGIFLSAYAPSIEFLYFSYCIVGGFGRCLTYTPSLILVTHYFNKRRGLAVGISTAGVGLGMFSFPPLIEALFGNFGYQGAMFLLSALSLETFVCAALFRPLSLHKKISKTKQINNLIKMARRGSVDARKIVEKLHPPKPINKRMAAVKNDNWHGSSEFSSTLEFTYVVPEPKRKSVFYDKMKQVKQVFKPAPKEERKPFLELSLLKDFPFLSLCCATLLFTMAMMSTFVFLPPLAKSKGVSQLQSAYLVSIIGMSDCLARFTSGIVLDMKRIKPYRVLVYNAVMFLVGVVSMVMPSIEGFVGFAIIAICYGCLTGTYIAQKSVVVVDILGLEKMTSSFGLLLGFQGIGSLIGPTISGLFRDVFGTYDEAFYFGGIGLFLGGLILLAGNIYKHIRDKRLARDAKKTDGDDDDASNKV